MKRRALLTAIGASAIAGCLGKYRNRTRANSGTTDDALRRVEVESADESPTTRPLSVSVEVVESAVIPDQPGRLRFTLANDSQTARVVESGRRKVFGAFFSEGDGQRLLLASADWELQKTALECWRPAKKVKPTDVVVTYELSAGERKTLETTLWDAPSNSGPCLEPGIYRFEHEYAFGDEQANDGEFMWGFDLTVTDS